MDFKELRKKSGMTQKQFSEYFEIPKRTIEDWDRGASKCPEYLLELMEYKLRKENIIPEESLCDNQENIATYQRKSKLLTEEDVKTYGDKVDQALYEAEKRRQRELIECTKQVLSKHKEYKEKLKKKQ